VKCFQGFLSRLLHECKGSMYVRPSKEIDEFLERVT